MRWLLVLMLTIGCHKAASRSEPATPVPPEARAQKVAYEERLAGFVEGPFVVSKKADGSDDHQGEGILWGGIAAHVLPCDKQLALSEAMADMVIRNGGALVRYEPLGEYAHGREITWDGVVGFYLAVADSVVRCAGSDLWRDAFALHLKYLDDHFGAIHENAPAVVPPGYDTIRVLIANRLGLSGEATGDAILALRVAILSTLVWQQQKPGEACYRANLAWMSLETAELFDVTLDGGERDAACQASADFDMPTWDHFCGRRHMKDWLPTFVENEWEYRHQRCGGREQPDGGEDATPALDWLLGYLLAYGRE